jgi:hypothetical protein
VRGGKGRSSRHLSGGLGPGVRWVQFRGRVQQGSGEGRVWRTFFWAGVGHTDGTATYSQLKLWATVTASTAKMADLEPTLARFRDAYDNPEHQKGLNVALRKALRLYASAVRLDFIVSGE